LVVTTGLLETVIGLTLWTFSPLIRPLLTSLQIRQQERLLYFIQIAPLLLALLLTAIFFIPQYLTNETNLGTEDISRFCLLLTSAYALQFGLLAFRGFRTIMRTMKFSSACKRSGRFVNVEGRLPVLALSHPPHQVALIGLLSPVILISEDLLQASGLNIYALDVVLAHEQAHARQRDNWKLLSLNLVPRLNLPLPTGTNWMQLWQSAAEFAADDEAVNGDTDRGLLLAETLLNLIRQTTVHSSQTVCLPLLNDKQSIAARIDRLIELPRRHESSPLSVALGLSVAILGILTMMIAVAPHLHALSEYLLHLE
jgi:beta-lactamase regulating signal transducer with metallopeptidase domain